MKKKLVIYTSLPEIEQGCLPLHVSKFDYKTESTFLFPNLFLDVHSSQSLIG